MLFKALIKSVVAGDSSQVKETVQSMLDAGTKPLDIVQKGLIAGMDVVGINFKVGDMFVPEVLMAAAAMKDGVDVVKPHLLVGDMPSLGTIAIGTVKGDLHDIGKNLLAMMMESGGFTVINVGVDIEAEEFVRVAVEQKADIIAISALLTTTMLGMKDTVDLLKEKGLLGKIKVIIGGAPISQKFCDEIGASGFAPDAARAVELCKKLLSA